MVNYSREYVGGPLTVDEDNCTPKGGEIRLPVTGRVPLWAHLERHPYSHFVHN